MPGRPSGQALCLRSGLLAERRRARAAVVGARLPPHLHAIARTARWPRVVVLERLSSGLPYVVRARLYANRMSLGFSCLCAAMLRLTGTPQTIGVRCSVLDAHNGVDWGGEKRGARKRTDWIGLSG
jgi:hypothetical protein